MGNLSLLSHASRAFSPARTNWALRIYLLRIGQVQGGRAKLKHLRHVLPVPLILW